MKIQIRKGTWETNSSSTHALVIKKEKPSYLPNDIYFALGEFGWEHEKYNDTETKASYLHTVIYNLYYDIENVETYNQYKKKINSILQDHNVTDIRWERPKKSTYAYVDHVDQCEKWLNTILENPDYLISWLFNDDSWLVTDNDNDDMLYLNFAKDKWDNKEEYYFYEKGN